MPLRQRQKKQEVLRDRKRHNRSRITIGGCHDLAEKRRVFRRIELLLSAGSRPKSYEFDLPVAALPALGNGQVTCINNPAKINNAVADSRAEMLRAVSGSMLLLKYRNFDHETERALRRSGWGYVAGEVRLKRGTGLCGESVKGLSGNGVRRRQCR